MAEHQAAQCYLDPLNERLWRGNSSIQLSNKLYRLLSLLVSNPDRLLGRQEIAQAVWPDLHVSAGLVREYVHDLRVLLGDDPASPRFIQTVRGRGYRFLGGIEIIRQKDLSSSSSETAQSGDSAIAPQAGSACHDPDEPSIAVLHFAGPSESIGDCSRILTEGLVGHLSRFRDLRVISQYSSNRFRLQSQTPAEIGRSLRARYIVCGNIRSKGRRKQITVELIGTASEQVLWSDRFLASKADLLDATRELTATVAARLGVQIEVDLARAAFARPESLQVRGLVLRAKALMSRFTREKNAAALRLLEKALENAPHESRVYQAISRAHSYAWVYGWAASSEQSRADALHYARSGIERDPLDARSYAELGVAYLYNRQFEEASAQFTRAVELNPNDPDVLVEYSDTLKYTGNATRALSLIRRAMHLNPYYPDWYLWYMADAYDSLGRSADVVATAKRMGDATEASRLVAANLAHLGMMKEARSKAHEVLMAHPNFRVSLWRRRQPWNNRDSAERLFEGMRRAGLPE